MQSIKKCFISGCFAFVFIVFAGKKDIDFEKPVW
jgi:hypothetical protein